MLTIRRPLLSLVSVAAVLSCGYLAAPTNAQAPMRREAPAPPVPSPQAPAVLDPIPPAPAPLSRTRGRVRPADLGRMIQQSNLRHGARLRSLPRATAASFDARALGWVGPVKDQQQCGSCWDFSGTGVVEIAYNKAGVGGGANQFILSEQYTLGCGRNGGCGGDDNTTVLDWAKQTGLPLTSAYGPYTAGGGLFTRCNYNSSMPLYRIPDWGFADSNGGQGVTSVADIKAAIQAYGCVGVAVAADPAFENWGDQNPSFANPFRGSGSTNIDHDVILVGWQDDSSKAGGYWILRNSWGTSWGVGGYMAIAYGANLVGTEAVFAMPPAAPAPPAPPVPPAPPAPPVPPPPTPVPTGVTFALVNPPAGATLDPASGSFSWTPPAGQADGPVKIGFVVVAGGQSATGSFTINVSAAATTITVRPIPDQSATTGLPFTLDLKQYVTVPPSLIKAPHAPGSGHPATPPAHAPARTAA